MESLSGAQGPRAASTRLIAIDATRGLALLGILIVNVQLFGEAFARYTDHRPESSGAGTLVSFYAMKVLCEGKFYPLFSLLFGMGLVLQMESVSRAGRSFVPLYLRRLGVLLMIGLLHAVLLWYGDILFVYALAGTILLACSRLSGRALTIAGVVIIGVSALFGGAVGGLMGGDHGAPAATADGTASVDAPVAKSLSAEGAGAAPAFFALMKGYSDGKIQGGPEAPEWVALETRAFRDGPYLDALLFRAMIWLFFLVFTLMGFGWLVVGMFLLGAGLIKLDVLSPARRGARVRLLLVGLVVGLPGATASVLIAEHGRGYLSSAISFFLLFACGPLMSLMYVSGVSLLVEGGLARRVCVVLASVGRMALSNYLTQTLVCTFIFYHWGLGQFGQWTRGERTLLALGVFAGQCVVSPLWLGVFRFGPMEWLWRTLTYLRVQPMRRQIE